MPLNDTLAAVLSGPTPAALWQLRGDLLEAGLPSDSPALLILGEFYQFLNELVASSTSRQYSHFASLLDIGAVGGVALQNLLEIDDSGEWWRRVLAGGLSEGLMVLAARQYVKAWEKEMEASYHRATWRLYDELWRLSAGLQPELPPARRRQLVEQLLVPLRLPQTSGTVKAALIGHLFQILFLIHFNMARRTTEIGD